MKNRDKNNKKQGKPLESETSAEVLVVEKEEAAGTESTQQAGSTPLQVSTGESMSQTTVVPPHALHPIGAARAVEQSGAGWDKVLPAWREAVTQDPQSEEARQGLALALYRAERWMEWVEARKAWLEQVPVEGSHKAALLTELAQVYKEKLRQEGTALTTLQQAWQTDPDNVVLLDRLAVQYEHHKRWSDMIALLQKKVALVHTAEEKIALLERIAGLYQERFSNVAEALRAYEQLLQWAPHHTAARVYLKTNYEKRRDWEKLVALLQTEVQEALPAEKAERAIALARLASDKLRRPGLSIELWQQVLTLHPSHQEALEELEKVYERERMWQPLALVCEQLVGLVAETTRKSALLQKLGLLYTERERQPERAIFTWQSLLDLEPENRRAQEALKRLYVEEKRWDELTALYERLQKTDELIRILERQAEVEESASTKVALLWQVASLYRYSLKRADRAMRTLEKILTLEEQHLGAIDALVELYTEANDARKWVPVLRLQIAHTTDRELRMERQLQLTHLLEHSLRDKTGAYQAYVAALVDSCKAPVAIRVPLERLARETRSLLPMVEAYETVLPDVVDAEEAVALRQTLAKLYETELNRPEQAVTLYEQLLDLDPAQDNVLDALERLYPLVKKEKKLVSVYEQKLERELDPAKQVALWFRLAHVWEYVWGDLDRALDAYRAILPLAAPPETRQAWEALARLLEKTQDWQGLQEALEQQLLFVTETEKAHKGELLFRLGRVREKQLGDVAGAIACYKQVLVDNPRHVGSREALEQWVAEEDYRAEILPALMLSYEHLEQWPQVIALLEEELAHLIPPEDQAQQVSVLLRIADLWLHTLQEPETAFSVYQRCFRINPSNPLVQAQLVLLTEQQNRWENLANLYQEVATSSAIDFVIAKPLLLQAADWYETKAGQREQSISLYQQLLDQDPADKGVLVHLERLFRATGRWMNLLEVYGRQVDLANSSTEKEALYLQIGTLWERSLANRDQATLAYEEALQCNPTSVEALVALDRLYTEQGRFDELRDNLQQQLRLSQEISQRVDLLLRLADVSERELADTETAFASYKQILQEQPSQPMAVVALERWLDQPDRALQAISVLLPLYEQKNAWEPWIRALQVSVDLVEDPAQRVPLLLQIARLYEEGLHQAEQAFATYQRILREQPDRVETMVPLERLSDSLHRASEVAALYIHLAQSQNDLQPQLFLWMRAAHMFENKLGHIEQAAAAYERALQADPAYDSAWDALEALYRNHNHYEALSKLLLRRSEETGTEQEQKAWRLEAAQLLETPLQRLEDSIHVYQQLFLEHGEDLEIIGALERLYRRTEQWSALAQMHRHHVEIATDPEEANRVWLQLGEVSEHFLQDTHQAIEAYEQALVGTGKGKGVAWQALARLYEQTAQWPDLLRVLEAQMVIATSPQETWELQQRMGALYEVHLRDLPRAIETYANLLVQAPSFEKAEHALLRLARTSEESALAAQTLLPIVVQRGDSHVQRELLQILISHESNPETQIVLSHQLAVLHENAEQFEEVVDTYAKVLLLDPLHEATYQRLEAWAARTRTWEQVAACYESVRASVSSTETWVLISFRLAALYEEKLHRVEQAATALQEGLDRDPENMALLQALDRLYTTHGKFAALVEVLDKEILLTYEDSARLALQFRLAQVYAQQLQDQTGALRTYQEILVTEPLHPPTVAALETWFVEGTRVSEVADVLEPVYRAHENWNALVTVHEAQVAAASEPMQQVSLLQKMADIHETKRRDPEAALRVWCRALRLQPWDEQVREETERLAYQTRQFAWVVEALLEEARGIRHSDAETRASMLHWAATWCETELFQLSRAETICRELLEIQGDHLQALVTLERLVAKQAKWPQCVAVLQRRLDLASSSNEKVELGVRLGILCHQILHDPERAIFCYQRVVSEEPSHVWVLHQLSVLYAERQAWSALVETYGQLANALVGDQAIAACYARMATLSSELLQDIPKAIALWNRVIDLRGEHEEALVALTCLYEREGLWRESADVLERRTHLRLPAHVRAALFQRLALLWEHRLQRPHQALEAWREALQIQPKTLEAWRAVIRLHREHKQWEELAEALQHFAEIAGTMPANLEEVVASYEEMARLYQERLLRPVDSIEAWKQVVARQPHNENALDTLGQLLLQEAFWEEAIALLSQRVAQTIDLSRQVTFLYQQAALWEEQMLDAAAAASVYQRIVAIHPHEERAVSHLERIYRSQGDIPAVVALFQSRVPLAETTERRVELLSTVARLCEQELYNESQALDAWFAIFQLNPTHETAWSEIERLTEATQRWNDWVVILVEQAQREAPILPQSLEADPSTEPTDGGKTHPSQVTNESLQQARLWIRAGQLAWSQLQQAEVALWAAEQALQKVPASKEAWELRIEAARASQQWTLLAAAVARVVELETNVERKVELWMEWAALCEFQLQEPDQAQHIYEQVLQTIPYQWEALVALERLYQKSNRLELLADILTKKAHVLQGQEGWIPLLYRLAALYVRLQPRTSGVGAEKQDDLGSSAKPKADAHPESATAEDKIATQFLMQAIATYQAILQAEPWQLPALKALESLYQETNQMDAYTTLLEHELEVVESESERVELYQRLANLYESQGRPEEASQAWENILAIDSHHLFSLQKLAMLYRVQERYVDLVDTYRRHIAVLQEVEPRVALFMTLAELYQEVLGDLVQAADAYKDALSLAPEYVPAWQALASLYEQMGEYEQAVDAWLQVTPLLSSSQEKAARCVQIGQIYEEKLDQPDLAESCYEEALRLDSQYEPAARKLIGLYESQGEWPKAIHALLQAENQVSQAHEKASFLYRAGLLYANKLHDVHDAAECMKRALRYEAHFLPAREFLQAFYIRAEQWGLAQPHLEFLAKHTQEPSQQSHFWMQLAIVHSHLHHAEQELASYKTAHQLAPEQDTVTLAYAKALAKQEKWDEALALYEDVLGMWDSPSRDHESAEVCHEMGLIRLRQGDISRALSCFQKALACNPHHITTLRALIDIYSARSKWEEVVQCLRDLVASLPSAERGSILVEWGDVLHDKLQLSEQALSVYLDALSLNPDNHRVLYKVFTLYSHGNQWRKAVEILAQLAETETSTLRQGKMFHIQGTLYRDHLQATDEALEAFNQALDTFFAQPELLTVDQRTEALKSFEAIDQICTQRRDWHTQERNYRRMLKRLPKTGFEPVAVMLWHALGEIYRSRLHDTAAAIQAFEVAVRMDPDSIKRQEILGELYVEAGPDGTERALVQYQRLAEIQPLQPENYRTLRKLYETQGDHDAVWCVSAILVYLKQAHPEEQQFFESYRPVGMVPLSSPWTEEVWTRWIYHPSQNQSIGHLLGALAPAVGLLYAEEHKQFQLKRRERHDVAQDASMLSKMLLHLSQVVQTNVPFELFLRPERPSGFQLANTKEGKHWIPSVIAGQHILGIQTEKDLGVVLSMLLAKLRTEHVLRFLLPSHREWSAVLMAALHWAQPAFPVPTAQVTLVQNLQERLSAALSPEVAAYLRQAVPILLQTQTSLDLATWGDAVDLTTHRVGLITSADLSAVARIILQEPSGKGLSPQERIHELLRFASSPEYLALRKHLGIAIG